MASSKTKKPDFVEEHRPRHTGIEFWNRVVAAKPEELAEAFTGHFKSLAESAQRPKNFIELYLGGNLRELRFDAARRPEHYSQQQHITLEALLRGDDVEDREANDLFLAYLRPTEVAERSRELAASITSARDDDVILEDGRTLSEQVVDEKTQATYQNQNNKDDIVII